MGFDFFLVILQLSHEIQIRGYDTAARFDVLKGRLEPHLGGVHEISETYGGATTDSRLTVNQYFAMILSYCICK